MADTSGVHTWLVLWKAAHAVEARALQSIDGTGLGASEFAILETLLHKGPLPVNVIGKKVLLTTGSITSAIDRLAERQLVVRKDDPSDRRVRRVQLTAKGRKLIEGAFETHAADLEKVVAVLTRQERATLIALLRKLGKGAEGTDATVDDNDALETSA
jgi:MarR family 2-MHQ and catechol resistance regulon transcriptional repressor